MERFDRYTQNKMRTTDGCDVMLLYHYMKPQYVLDTIQKNRIKLATVTSLNDPYEMLPDVVTPDGRHAPIEFTRIRMREILKNTGILCLSETVSSPVMWAHYANSHTGATFEFEFAEKDLTKDDIIKVEYGHDRVQLNTEDAEKPDRIKTTIGKLIGRKGVCWEYEQEYRLVFPLQMDGVLMDEEGRFFRALPTALRRVILGVDCRVGAGPVQKALNLRGFDDIVVTQARLSEERFEVEVEPLGSTEGAKAKNHS